MRDKRTLQFTILALVALQSAAASISASYIISTDKVLAAMVRKQLPVSGVEITMPTRMRAAVADPQLVIEQVVRVDGKHSELRVACSTRSQCMPFYATARWSGKSAGNEPVSEAPAAIQALPAQVALRSGSHATLILDDERLHLRLPVICMTGGSPGDKVKVTTMNHRQTFEAVVLNADELKGSLR